jgi:microbial collagenase
VVTLLVNDEITHHISAKVNETINFSATETFDADGDTLSYLWDFGDGSTNTSQMTNHSFSSNGPYQVTLTVSEDAENGLEETDKIVVTVKETSKGNGNGNG